jgi:uncharacterized membrane protein
MKGLIFSAFSILVLTMVAGMASALVFNAAVISQPASVDQAAGSFPVSFNITYTGTQSSITVNLTSTTSVGTISSVTFDQANPITLTNETGTNNKVVTATVNFPAGQTGNIAGIITADPTSGSAVNLPFNVLLTSSANNPSLSVSKTQELTRTQNGIISVQNNGNVALTSITFAGSGDFSATFSPSSIASLAPGASASVTVVRGDLSNLKFGDNTLTVSTTGHSGSSNIAANSVSFVVSNGLCANGKVGNLTLTKLKIDNTGKGTDTKWNLLDTVNVDVKVENIGKNSDADLSDIVVELQVLDSSGNNVAGDFDFTNSDEDAISVGSLDHGDDETVTFTFKVPADIDAGTYKIAAKGYDDGSESTECADLVNGKAYSEVKVERVSDHKKFIAFDNMVPSPVQPTCGETVTFTTDVFNVGDEDQDQVKINLKNTALGIDQSVEIRNNLDMGDKQTVSFDFTIPQGAQNKDYLLDLTSDYDYKNGVYRQSSNVVNQYTLKVIGCNTPSGPANNASGAGNSVISASLGSSAVAGQELTIDATITNPTSSSVSYVMDAKDYDGWASIKSFSPRIVTVDAGQSKDVVVKFTVNSDAVGEQTFTLQTIANGKTTSRDVSVNVEATPSSSGFSGFSLGNNGYLLIIGAVNVILIVLIIIVAIRISRR